VIFDDGVLRILRAIFDEGVLDSPHPVHLDGDQVPGTQQQGGFTTEADATRHAVCLSARHDNPQFPRDRLQVAPLVHVLVDAAGPQPLIDDDQRRTAAR
jgi:hypothetical protein